LSVALLATTLSGCFLFTEPPPPDPAPPLLPEHLPRECQKLAAKVPDPGAKPGDDGFDIASRYRAAWLKGNHRLAAVRECEDQQADVVDRGGQ
jgi:hypothetical protein